MGYASWGSNDAKFTSENYLSIRFVPGAIAETAVSTSARGSGVKGEKGSGLFVCKTWGMNLEAFRRQRVAVGRKN